MSETLLSVGIDLGTTTTQMILSRLVVENTASVFSVPTMEITDREILYRSSIHFTPLLSPHLIDAQAVKTIIETEYANAGIQASDIQTGAVIITGETARKENAREVLQALSGFAGEFVVATAGPALESVLAARGAGADLAAKQAGRHVLHMDIGGGTTNMALFDPEGNLLETGCLNVGGRLMKFDHQGNLVDRSPVLKDMDCSDPQLVVERLVQALEEAAGLRPKTTLLQSLITDRTVTLPQAPVILSFSGGVADLIGSKEDNWLRYGDLGVLLGRAIGKSRLCEGQYLLGKETIRATVVGAGSYSMQLSGSTIYLANVSLPLHDLPVIRIDQLSPEQIRQKRKMYGGQLVAYALAGWNAPEFAQINLLADTMMQAVAGAEKSLVVALEQDMAKALGQALQLRLGNDAAIICLDGISIPEGSYLDLAQPVGNGAALPVVVKTLAFI